MWVYIGFFLEVVTQTHVSEPGEHSLETGWLLMQCIICPNAFWAVWHYHTRANKSLYLLEAMKICTKTNLKRRLWNNSRNLATFFLSVCSSSFFRLHLSYRDSPVALLLLLQGKAPLNGLGAACPCIFNGHARHAEVSAWIMYGGWVVEKEGGKRARDTECKTERKTRAKDQWKIIRGQKKKNA